MQANYWRMISKAVKPPNEFYFNRVVYYGKQGLF